MYNPYPYGYQPQGYGYPQGGYPQNISKIII